MRLRILVVGMCIIAMSGFADSEGSRWKAGLNAGYTFGGDIEDSSFAPGAQILYATDVQQSNFNYFFELGGTVFSDGMKMSEMGIGIDLDLDITALSMVAGIGGSSTERMRWYALGGVGYYIPDATAEIDASGVAEIFDAPGLTVSATADIDMDNALGWILGAGVAYELTERLEVFTDYRYTMLKLEAKVSGVIEATYFGQEISEKFKSNVEGDYNHGIARIGLNYIF